MAKKTSTQKSRTQPKLIAVGVDRTRASHTYSCPLYIQEVSVLHIQQNCDIEDMPCYTIRSPNSMYVAQCATTYLNHMLAEGYNVIAFDATTMMRLLWCYSRQYNGRSSIRIPGISRKTYRVLSMYDVASSGGMALQDVYDFWLSDKSTRRHDLFELKMPAIMATNGEFAHLCRPHALEGIFKFLGVSDECQKMITSRGDSVTQARAAVMVAQRLGIV